MQYVEFEINSGKKNMQIDSDLLNLAIEKRYSEPIFRLYGWSPACVSLGRNQSDDFLNKEFLKSKNIDVVRRLTGGRALLHDEELTYSFICPVTFLENGQSVVNSYKEISGFLIKGFVKLGIKLEFPCNKKINVKNDYCMTISTGADLCYEGKKLIGSAQFRKEGYILQHGSILINYDLKLLNELFGKTAEDNSLTCINTINDKLTIEDLKNVLIESFVQ